MPLSANIVKSMWLLRLVTTLLLVWTMVGCERPVVEPDTSGSSTARSPAPGADRGGQATGIDKSTSDEGAVGGEVPWTTPFMWRIDGANGPTFLMGTVHLGFDLDNDGPAAIMERFAQTRTLVTEANLDDLPGVVGDYVNLPDGATLSELLGPEDWQKLLDRYPMASSLDRQQPFVVLSALIAEMTPNQSALLPSMDVVLHNAASRGGYQLAYLETARDQLEVLVLVLDIVALREMINEWDQQRKDLIDMMNAYRGAEIDAFSKIVFNAETDEEKRRLEILLDDRNAKWMPAIEKHIADGNVFIAVGAAHLVGENGLVSLLEANGHVLTPVR